MGFSARPRGGGRRSFRAAPLRSMKDPRRRGPAGGRGRWRSRRLGLGVRGARVLRGRCWCVGCSPWTCFCARAAAAAGGSWGCTPGARACVGCSRGSAVPREDRRGLDDDQAGPPASPQPREAHPEDAVPSMELWPSDGSLKDGQLMAQGRVLEGNRRPVNKGARARAKVQRPIARSIVTPWQMIIVRGESLPGERGVEILEVQSG